MSQAMESRLNKAVQLYRANRVKKIIVTGGQAYNGICEGDMMRDFLLLKGVAVENIIVENNAKNTEENTINSLAIIKKNNFKNVAIVSHFYHIARIKLMFKKQGFYAVELASVLPFDYKVYWFSLFREFIAYYYYWLFK